MLWQVEVDVPLCVHTAKHASRGVVLSPQPEHALLDQPQIERQVDVDVPFVTQSS